MENAKKEFEQSLQTIKTRLSVFDCFKKNSKYNQIMTADCLSFKIYDKGFLLKWIKFNLLLFSL